MAGQNTPIQIDLEINSDGVQQGSEQAATALQQIETQLKGISDVSEETGTSISKISDASEEALGKVSDASHQAGESFSTISEGSTEAAKVVDRDLTQEVSTSLEEVSKSSEKAGKGISEGIGAGTKEAEGHGEELKMGFANVGAGIASSMGDAGMVISQAMYTMGPAGVAAGLALAAGLGLAQSALQGNADEINKNAQAVSDLAKQIEQAGGDLSQVDFTKSMTDWGNSIQQTQQWWQIFGDQTKTGFQEIQDEASKAGVSWTDAFKGVKGSTDDAQSFLAKTQDQWQQLDDQMQKSMVTNQETGASFSTLSQSQQDQYNTLKKLRDQAQQNIDTQNKANQQSKDQQQLLSTITTTVGGLTDAQKAQAQQQQANIQADKDEAAAIKGLSDQQDQATSAIVNARNANNTMMDAFDAAKTTIAQNGKTVDENTKAGRNNLAMLVDLGQKIRDNEKAQIANGQSVNDATSDMNKNRDAFINSAVAAGMSTDAAKKLADQMGLTPKVVSTDFQSNAAQAKSSADDLHTAIDKVPTIHTTGMTLQGIEDAEAQIRNLVSNHGMGWHLTVGVNGDVSAAQNAIAGLNGTRVAVDFVGNNGGRAITN